MILRDALRLRAQVATGQDDLVRRLKDELPASCAKECEYDQDAIEDLLATALSAEKDGPGSVFRQNMKLLIKEALREVLLEEVK